MTREGEYKTSPLLCYYNDRAERTEGYSNESIKNQNISDLVLYVRCGMVVTWQTIITAGAVLGALIAIIGGILKVHKWYLRQEKQEEELKRYREENTIICYALMSCLDGLQQLGANHTVPQAKEKLEKYLNQQAHK